MDAPQFSLGRSLLLSVLMLTWEGLTPALVMQPVYLGKQLVAGLILIGFAVWAILSLMRGIRFNKDGIVSAAAIGYAVSVTLIYSTFGGRYPASEWLLATYMLLPLAIFPLLTLMGISWSEVVAAIFISAAVCSLLSIADQLFRFPIFDQFVRGSINNQFARRMFLMRIETACASLMLLAWVSIYFYRSRILLYGPLLVAVIFVLFRVSESRQSIVSVLTGLVVFIMAGGISSGKLIRRLPLFIFAGVPALLYLLWPYIQKFLSANDYVREGNIDIRLQAMQFYGDRFHHTHGLGFGVLSSGDNATNFFALAQRQGNGSWPFFLADTGILSSLYQFGWVGFAFAFIMPIWVGLRLIRASKSLAPDVRVFPLALGAFMIGSVVHPWPQNYYTLDWSIMFGCLAWYAASDLERLVASRRRTARGAASPAAVSKRLQGPATTRSRLLWRR